MWELLGSWKELSLFRNPRFITILANQFMELLLFALIAIRNDSRAEISSLSTKIIKVDFFLLNFYQFFKQITTARLLLTVGSPFVWKFSRICWFSPRRWFSCGLKNTPRRAKLALLCPLRLAWVKHSTGRLDKHQTWKTTPWRSRGFSSIPTKEQFIARKIVDP